MRNLGERRPRGLQLVSSFIQLGRRAQEESLVAGQRERDVGNVGDKSKQAIPDLAFRTSRDFPNYSRA